MRVAALALTALVLAGCGSHSSSGNPNGEASRPASRVFADARAAATRASSTHVSGNFVFRGTAITLDLSVARGRGAKGSASVDGLGFDLVTIGDIAYIHGSDAFWQHYAGGTIAQLLHDKWIKARVSQPRFRVLAAATSIGVLFAKLSSSHGTLVNDGKTAYKGAQVVAIRDPSDRSKLYVAATGAPYPVAITGNTSGHPWTVSFDGWNKPVSLSAPKGAIDASQFGG
jgi:hypothetical protein